MWERAVGGNRTKPRELQRRGVYGQATVDGARLPRRPTERGQHRNRQPALWPELGARTDDWSPFQNRWTDTRDP